MILLLYVYVTMLVYIPGAHRGQSRKSGAPGTGVALVSHHLGAGVKLGLQVLIAAEPSL